MKDSWVIAGLAALSLFMMVVLGWQIRERLSAGSNDFVSFYAGGRLAGTPDLYNAARARQVQLQTVGVTGEAWRYIRLPFHAAFLWPIARLPYHSAYLLWETILLAALAGFAWTWPKPSRSLVFLYTCFSFPVFTSIMNGQDVALLLLCIAASAACGGQGSWFTAGLLLSLCAAKYHLFLLLPLLIVAQKRWRLGLGVLAGGAILLGISFGAAGLSWPWAYHAALTDQTIHPDVGHMPNLRGLSVLWPSVHWWGWFVAAGVVFLTWWTARRTSFEYGLGIVLAGGLLISYHAYLSDCALLLPAGLAVMATARWWGVRLVAFLLLLPFGYLLLLLEQPWPALVPVAILALVVLMAIEVLRA